MVQDELHKAIAERSQPITGLCPSEGEYCPSECISPSSINLIPEAQIEPRILAVFHMLWGKAHGNPDYNKAEWTTLSILLERKGIHT
jgi:hypothetical protein